jgi:EmrB/QacA subfamily drug resistance transporter
VSSIRTHHRPAKRLTLIAMIFAVSMMFIDQTVVVLAVPHLEDDLSLSANGAQWVINGYLLALAAMFAFGGKLADVLGPGRMVKLGVVGFAVFSALCGATPSGDYAETWLIACRVLQGVSAAILFPAALAIVVAAFDVKERGRALATFFGVTGLLTAVGPLAGGYLTEWTWRSIFWINVPIAIIALLLTAKAKPTRERRHVPIDIPGAVLISAAMGLVVLALQQAAVWGWTDERTIGCVVVGVVLLALFGALQLRRKHPLIDLRVFRKPGFAADSLVLMLMSAVFVPLFFFASVYGQAALGYDAQQAAQLLLVLFGGFFVAAQIGGRIVDSRGSKPSVLLGCVLAVAGLITWGGLVTNLDFSAQWHAMALTGAGLGFVLGPVSADALGRAGEMGYGAVTGINQTARNFGASLGLAVMGSVFLSQNVSRVTDSLTANGVPAGQAERLAHQITSEGGGGAASQAGAGADAIIHAVQLDIAHSTQIILYAMAGIMAVAFVVAKRGMLRGKIADDAVEDGTPDTDPPATVGEARQPAVTARG